MRLNTHTLPAPLPRAQLEEAAACEPKMVKEVVVPLLVVDTSVLICISTLKESDNSYSKMFEARKPDGSKMFEQVIQH